MCSCTSGARARDHSSTASGSTAVSRLPWKNWQMTRTRAGTRRASKHDLATGRTAAANRTDAIRRIVVRELFPFADVACGPNPDGVAHDLSVTVGRAGVVDVARDVAAHGRVTHVEVIQLEAPDVALPEVPRLALEALAVGDLLARVID